MTSPVRAARPAPRHQPADPVRRDRPDLHVVGAPVRRVRGGVVVAVATVVVFGALLAAAVAHSLLVSGQVHLDRVGVETRQEREL
ncbi:MAG TPA: hypothetical protein VHK88_15975, partial [Aquihabitans sp.]|nr:hypothetical protein [Aquihabitans sp.]